MKQTRVPIPVLSRAGTVCALLIGLFAVQALQFGASLTGREILLPLDILGIPDVYLPGTPEVRAMTIQEPFRSDPVLFYEPARRFAAREVRSGRIPAWDPSIFSGAAFVRWGTWGPLAWPSYLWPSSRVLAWTELLVGMIAGTGTFVFARSVLGVGRVSGLVVACCVPVSGFFVLWRGFPLTHAVSWLPWVLWATEASIAHPKGLAPIWLAASTAATIASGHLDMAGLVLLSSGLWAGARVLQGWRSGAGSHRTQLSRIFPVVTGWAAGFLLAAPVLVPLVAELSNSGRVAERAGGLEMTPPGGLRDALEIVIPDLRGATRTDSVRTGPTNRQESVAAGYVGCISTCLLAVLGLGGPSRPGSPRVCLAVLVLVAFGWCLGVPGLVATMQVPGPNLLPFNRMTFSGAFGLLSLAAMGLDRLLRGDGLSRRELAASALLLGVAAGWSAYRVLVPPEPVRSELARRLAADVPLWNLRSLADLETIQATFRQAMSLSALWGIVGLLAVAILLRRRGFARQIGGVLAVVMLLEPLVWSRDLIPSADPRLDYPEIPVVSWLRERPERFLGVSAFPPNLASVFGLRDVRGYDGIEPSPYVELLLAATDPQSIEADYARTQWMVPSRLSSEVSDTDLSPILDLLGVRWLVFRGRPPEDFTPAWSGLDYWVTENPDALPRVRIPLRVEVVEDAAERVTRLADPEHRPAEVALLEAPLTRPLATGSETSGEVRIVEDSPSRVEIESDLDRESLVVLADRWHPGWRVRIDGVDAPSLRVDHALRGVVVPGGRRRVTWSFRPVGLWPSLCLSAVAAVGLSAAFFHRRRRSRRSLLPPGRDHSRNSASSSALRPLSRSRRSPSFSSRRKASPPDHRRDTRTW